MRNMINIERVNSVGVWVLDRCFLKDWLDYLWVMFLGRFCINCFIVCMVLLLL